MHCQHQYLKQIRQISRQFSLVIIFSVAWKRNLPSTFMHILCCLWVVLNLLCVWMLLLIHRLLTSMDLQHLHRLKEEQDRALAETDSQLEQWYASQFQAHPSCPHRQSSWALLTVTQDYFIISSEKLKCGWTLITSQCTITHILYFKLNEQLLKIQQLYIINKLVIYVICIHTYTHTHC